jgi:hypothetical protein
MAALILALFVVDSYLAASFTFYTFFYSTTIFAG